MNTDYRLELDDLLERSKWVAEVRGLELTVELPPDRGLVVVDELRGVRPFHGFYNPKEDKITIKLNPKNEYPFTHFFPTGTEQISPTTYRYTGKHIRFKDPNELARFIFCHELSHRVDKALGYRLAYKQTKANRFAFRNCEGIGEEVEVEKYEAME